MNAIAFLWPHIDILWLPVLVLASARKHVLIALAYGLACMVMMRLMIELAASAGFAQGVLGLWHWPLFARGLLVFSVFNAFFAASAYTSRRTTSAIFLAAALSLFFTASFVFALAMVL